MLTSPPHHELLLPSVGWALRAASGPPCPVSPFTSQGMVACAGCLCRSVPCHDPAHASRADDREATRSGPPSPRTDPDVRRNPWPPAQGERTAPGSSATPATSPPHHLLLSPSVRWALRAASSPPCPVSPFTSQGMVACAGCVCWSVPCHDPAHAARCPHRHSPAPHLRCAAGASVALVTKSCKCQSLTHSPRGGTAAGGRPLHRL